MDRASASSSAYNLGTILSPGVLDYNDNSVDANKGWSSERVPHHSSGSRRHISAATLTPFYSGRTMPSKWDDAERWICSPVSGFSGAKNLNFQSQRRQKSKSGPIPILPTGIGFYPNSSPAMQVLDGHRVRNFVVSESPFSTGVLMPGGVPLHYRGLMGNDNSFTQSTAPTRWADLASESSLPGSLDEKVDDMKDMETVVSPVVVSRRDMATQMSPSSTSSSPRGRSSSPPSTLPDNHPARMEIREVQVDKRANIISSSERRGPNSPKKGLPDVADFNQNGPSACFSSWEISETVTNVSKLQREEAKIAAWENLQQAKAEAAIRKLEMKLEKKRSSSMDKILYNLRVAHKKAEEMRSSVSDRQENQSSKTYHKVTFLNKHAKMSSLKSCFTCCYVFSRETSIRTCI